MTYRELSEAWDVYANRHAELKYEKLLFFDEYEKSLFITQAADEIVKGLLPFYDRNEKIKKQLLPITKSVQVSLATGIDATKKIESTTLLYEMPEDVLYVVLEFLKTSSGVIIERIKPLADDETAYVMDNPFRVPTTRPYAYRNSLSIGSKHYSEIITGVLANTSPVYFMRYVSEVPAFIVTESLLGASIMGLSSNADIDEIAPLEMLHNKILNKAIAIGYEAKSDDINSKVAREKASEES
jgi:hypothetical protein